MTEHINDDQKNRLVKKAKVAAAAMADFWDELHEHENEAGEFDNTVEMISELAGNGGTYPASYDRYDAVIWEAITKCWEPT
ncbi:MULTISPECIES: hypothetical protein [unclassified Mesorhizobium]|uniref:hypothetical protein n=1 Tax=unclassified Mesorhizobium TaxID=325217 RepID=UPI00112DB3B1|nr:MULTISPECIES: hypothetical protein [unclassified Mesorhizobium]TPL42586.1 hypothetical protein FJ961_07810 [Mesorhizobium sp. B2-4-5]TPL66586.1 hypothetical protein FJ949_09470 [Mesorhizobium sp. B2-4-1]